MTPAEVSAAQLAAILDAASILLHYFKDSDGLPERYIGKRDGKVIFELFVSDLSLSEIPLELETLLWANLEHQPPATLSVIPVLNKFTEDSKDKHK